MKPVKKYKIARRLQAPLFEKTQSQKFALREQRKTPKRFGMRKVSDYGKHLIEKQKVRYLYGISEKVLKNYVTKSITRPEDSETFLFSLLERRLDNLVYRIGLADTRRMARQIVSHGHITVNGRKTTIPSYQIRDTDVIGVREGSKNTNLFKEVLSNLKKSKTSWIEWNPKDQTASIKADVEGEDNILNLSSVFEYYSR